MHYYFDRTLGALYVIETPPSSKQSSLWITIILPGKLEDCFVHIATEDLSGDIEILNSYGQSLIISTEALGGLSQKRTEYGKGNNDES